MSQSGTKRKKAPIFEKPAYHYTTGLKVAMILESGLLEPVKNSLIDSTETERPVLLFSTNANWEVMADNTLDRSGIAGTAEQGRGIYRFIFPVRKLHAWHDGTLQRKAKMLSSTVKSLEDAAASEGAKPAEWYGSVNTLSVLKTGLEILRNDGVWIAYDQFDKANMQPFFGVVAK